ncbi:MAG: histidine phosphatase family protein [Rhodobacteraceae bacterium]|nr:histidine phosphatase family protein [Paracoccaceae bacterium]NCW65876.1 histidine phosphatase family protein [Paracoccaceae bacterium]NDD32888.1 histidine phosphatase family protein [Paracoccaceae bacterium]NDD88510.1 histidine phosphatase family protein [Paracoccaceae bacterium]NDH71663.1 histidine phosphatase family protein [Paracoccaceae bacterium]
MDRPRLRGRIRVPKIIFVRHGQAQFGQANYDKLSEVGHEQAVALGKAIFEQGITIDHWVSGDMVRHAETLRGISQGMRTQVSHQIVTPDLNEYDFTGQLNARFVGSKAPVGLHTDRKTHFRALRETLALWQNDKILNPPESWAAFETRLKRAQQTIFGLEGDTILVVSSGGAISKIVANALGVSHAKQVDLQLQIKNASMSTFIYSRRTGGFFLNAFNETPFVSAKTQHLLTYS